MGKFFKGLALGCILGGLLFGGYRARADLMDGMPGGGFRLLPPVTYTGGAPQTSVLDCFRNVFLGGNAQFTLTIGAAPIPWCTLHIINIDSYTGAGSGRGKQMVAAGITSFWLYPGQHWGIRWNSAAGNWQSDQALNSSFGILWSPPTVPHFFVDTGGSNGGNDGLASGAGGAFATKGYCAQVAYAQVYTRNNGSIQCSQTAGQNIQEFVQVFYPLNGGGTLIFNSTVPGTQTTWTCPASQSCLQLGDGALVGSTDFAYVQNPSSHSIIVGHNHGVFDLNADNSFGGANPSTFPITGDFDIHFNVNNGFNYFGTFIGLWGSSTTSPDGICQGCKFNINGPISVASGQSATLTRFFINAAGQLTEIAGNVSYGTTNLSTGQALVSGNSVTNNFSGAPPGGAPTLQNGGQYCTSFC